MKHILLRIFSDKEPEVRKRLISSIDKKTVKEIRKLIFNILIERIRITESEKKNLKPYSGFMIKLSEGSIENATKLIKKEGFIILPKLEKILSKVISSIYKQ